MSRFFVGQRVVLVRGIDLVSPAKNKGLTGTIELFFNVSAGSPTHRGPVSIDCDCAVVWDNGNGCWQNTAQLEPLSPNEPCDADFKESLDNLIREHA